MSKALFFIENYYAGGSDKVAQLLLKNLDYEKKYLFINKANDTSIVLKELKDTDLEVIYYNLITIAELGEYANSKRKNLPLYVFLKTLNLIIRYPLLIFSFFYFYFKFKKINADVFIANNGGYPGGEFCRMATISASFLGIGNYHIVHSIPTRYFFRPYKLIEDYIDRLIDTRSKIICVSKDISKKLKIIRNIKQEPKVIHNGVQVSHQKKYIKTSTIKLLNVASLYDLKNQAFLLEVIRKLVEKSYINIELHFVGKEEEKGYLDKLRKLVKEYKIEDYVFFHGFSDPYSFYHNCDIFLLSSKIYLKSGFS